MSASNKSDVPQLALHFFRGRDERTELDRRIVTYPWSLTQPFYLKSGPTGMATVIPQSSSGGLYRGDVQRQCISVDTSAAVHLASQGATLAHAVCKGKSSQSKWDLTVADGGWLEVLNDPLVLGSDSDVQLKWSIKVGPIGTCLLIDSWTWLNQDDKPLFNNFNSEIIVQRPKRNILALERAMVSRRDVERLQDVFTSNIRGFVNGLLFCPKIDPSLTILFQTSLNEIKNCWIGVSTLPGEVGIVIRAACGSAGVIAHVSETIWDVFRRWRLGSKPEPRRRSL